MYSLALASTYQGIQVALFQHDSCLIMKDMEKQQASKQIIIALGDMLQEYNLTMHDITFCVVKRGPSPFTTLRTTLATVQGLQAATNVAIVGIDGLHALVYAYYQPATTLLVVQNAFGGDVYYALAQSTKQIQTGYYSLEQLLLWLATISSSQPLHIIGNALPLYEHQIRHAVAHLTTIFSAQIIDHCPIIKLWELGYTQWKAGAIEDGPIMPLYLKKPPVFIPKQNPKSPTI